MIAIIIAQIGKLVYNINPVRQNQASRMFAIPNQRTQFITGFLICCGLVGQALYFQYGAGMEPCPLCIFQRIAVFALGLIFLLAALVNPTGILQRLFGFLWLATAVIGGAISGRHVWLQNLPADQIPACGPGLDYMLEVFPFTEMLNMVLKGSGECAEVSWRLLGLSMPGWMLLIFAAFAVFGLWNLFKPK